MLTGAWVYVAAVAASFTIATVASPAGVSGAVLLLPFQVSVLGTPSPAVTPTNLLYNVVATPGALYRYWRQGQTGGSLTRVLLAGTIPGVIAGSVVRVELLPGTRAFDAVIAIVLVPLGAWLLVRRQRKGDARPFREFSWPTLTVAAAIVGCVGGIYGIGGGINSRPGSHRLRTTRERGRTCHAVLDLCGVCSRRDRLRDPLHAPSRFGRAGLGCRRRSRPWRATR